MKVSVSGFYQLFLFFKENYADGNAFRPCYQYLINISWQV